jgi:uncharacterized tellurite resistance protein B-like protein
MLQWLSERLFPGDGDGETSAPAVSPQIGAAGLLIEAAQRDGTYTEVEQDLVAQALMKLFHIGHPAATTLRQEAEEAQVQANNMVRFAAAARALDRPQKEALVVKLWEITESDGETRVPEAQMVRSAIDILDGKA